MKKILYFIFAVTAIAFAASCSSKSSPGEAAKTYMEYLKDGDYDKFIDGIYFPPETSAQEVAEGKEMMAGLLQGKGGDSLQERGGITRIEVVAEEIDDDGKTAQVTLRVTYGNGDVDEDESDMILDSGRWKMDVQK